MSTTGTKRLTRDRVTFFFDPQTEPALTIAPGERIIVETQDAHNGAIPDKSVVFASLSEMFARLGGANPVTGPIYVEGARAGHDVLQVRIHEIVPGPVRNHGYTLLAAELGGLVSNFTLQDPLPARTVICDFTDEGILFPARGGTITLPFSPFLGTIGVAPAEERRYTFFHGPNFMGNVDIREVAAGSTIVLPVNVDGGLLGMGDAHARQGHGEISGAAIECQADAELTIDVSTREDAGFVGLPQINTDEWIGSVAGFAGVNLGDVVRAAYVDLVRRLEKVYGFELGEAYLLTCQAAEVSVGQVVDPLYSALVKIDRRYVE